MLTITDGGSLTRALRMSIDFHLKQLLIERRDQLGGDITDIARFIVIQPGDNLKALEQELGFPGLSDPEHSFGCEWIADHGDTYEAVWVLTDNGFAHVVLVPKQHGIDPELLRLCALHVTDPV